VEEQAEFMEMVIQAQGVEVEDLLIMLKMDYLILEEVEVLLEIQEDLELAAEEDQE
jgi:hypothetical protein